MLVLFCSVEWNNCLAFESMLISCFSFVGRLILVRAIRWYESIAGSQNPGNKDHLHPEKKKNSTPFHKKTFNKLGVERNCCDLIKAVYEKFTVTNHIQCWMIEKIRNNTRMAALATYILSRKSFPEQLGKKRNKRRQNWKGKLCLQMMWFFMY